MTDDHRPRIVSDPAILGGKPIIAGTRISVAHVLENLAGGMTVDDYVREYPSVDVPAVRAALEWAARESAKPRNAA